MEEKGGRRTLRWRGGGEHGGGCMLGHIMRDFVNFITIFGLKIEPPPLPALYKVGLGG